MEQIPDSWPPEESPAPLSLEAPVFPLPGAFLFPGQIMTLHIFEPRYRAMIEDSLDGPGRIVMCAVESTAGQPKLRPIAGLGEIARHDRMPDGRFAVWLGGIGRVRIEEVPSDRPYRRVRCQLVEEIGPAASDEAVLRNALVNAIEARASTQIQLTDDLPIGLLSDLLSQSIPLPLDRLGPLFEERNIARRAELALDAHADYPNDDSEP